MAEVKLGDKLLEKEKLKKVLKEFFPDLDLDNHIELLNAIDSFILSILMGTSANEVESFGRLEVLKNSMHDFIKSKEFKKWREKIAEEKAKEMLEQKNAM